MIDTAVSRSTEDNVKRARKLLGEFSKIHGTEDPFVVSIESNDLILNLLHKYCRVGTENALSDDTMGGLIQGLRRVYDEHGHDMSWTIDRASNKAWGNPLTNNTQVVALRKAHRVYLAQYGKMKHRARPITASIICNHAAKYWFGKEDSRSPIDCRDIILHAVLTVGLNVGLRYDEISKIMVDSVSVDDDNITMTINTVIKNSTISRDYRLLEWPAHCPHLRSSILMDPKIALLTWLEIRGTEPGPLFCNLKETRSGFILDCSKHWSVEKFNSHLQNRLLSVGFGPSDVLRYTGHSIKRGCVQFYRSLNVRDEYIMQIIQMTGDNAYRNYCAAFNDDAPEDIPRFSSIESLLVHCDSVLKEKGLTNAQEFSDYYRDIYE